MLDIGEIKRSHRADEQLRSVLVPSKEFALRMFRRAHQHRGWLLERLEQTERERDEALAQVGQLERLVEALEAIQQKAVLG